MFASNGFEATNIQISGAGCAVGCARGCARVVRGCAHLWCLGGHFFMRIYVCRICLCGFCLCEAPFRLFSHPIPFSHKRLVCQVVHRVMRKVVRRGCAPATCQYPSAQTKIIVRSALHNVSCYAKFKFLRGTTFLGCASFFRWTYFKIKCHTVSILYAFICFI